KTSIINGSEVSRLSVAIHSGFFIGILSPSAARAIAKAYRYSTLPCPCWHNNIYQRLIQPTLQIHFFMN
ncbi:hypothetical protein Q0U29_19420, partial [Escherichia coli O103:H43]